jgi:hypothetical protein
VLLQFAGAVAFPTLRTVEQSDDVLSKCRVLAGQDIFPCM